MQFHYRLVTTGYTTEMYTRRINLEYINSTLHHCCKSIKSTLLGNTDYRVTDKVSRNLEKETNEVAEHGVRIGRRCVRPTDNNPY